MFAMIPLREAFRHVAEDDDWSEFSQLEAADETDLWIISMGSGLTPYERRVMRYRELWDKFSRMARERLISGEWTAEGFNPAFGTQAQPIPPSLWRTLDINLGGHATGAGYSFVNLLISETPSPALRQPHAVKANLRSDLRKWLQIYSETNTGPVQVQEVLEAAQEEFGGQISGNMFEEVWSNTEKPAGWVRQGRPPKTNRRD